MARPKSIKANVVASVENYEKKSEVNETELLKQQLAELNRKFELLLTTKQQESKANDDEENKLSSDEYIKVMSLCPHQLNLSTQRGDKNPFVFNKFGEVKRILYSDLAKIIRNHDNFVRDGSFVILDKRVIRTHGLDDAYEKILTKENFEKILSGNDSDAINLFKNANSSQQEYIVQVYIKKAVDGEEIDLNLIDRMSRVVGYSINDKIEKTKETARLLKEIKSAE